MEIALIFAVFFLQGAWPVPDVNEPYYLGKAIHYWNPDWVQGDFFLDSADAHQVFYFSFGWLSLRLSPVALAWTGRVLTWGLLAWAWHRLSWTLAPRRGMALLSGALFACLMERCHMAGEWVIGGVEAKGFAYVLVFLGLEAMVRDEWNRAWLLWGAASLLHVVVGGWVVVAAGFAWVVSGRAREPLWRMLPGLLGGLLISLPSLIPLVALDWDVDPAAAARAHWVYVYCRLPHHLIVSEFRRVFLLRFGAQVAVWAVIARAMARTPRTPWRIRIDRIDYYYGEPLGKPERLGRFVVGAVVISLIGAVLSAVLGDDPAVAARVLRFYWFRLSDVAVPMGVALFAVDWIDRLLREGKGRMLESLDWFDVCSVPRIRAPRKMFVPGVPSRAVAGWLVLAGAAGIAVLHVADFARLRIEVALGLQPALPRADAKVDKLGGYAAWCDICEQIAQSDVIPKDARFLTPIDASTFKWRTQRAEVVTRKEIPQDAKSIVRWWERLRDIHGIERDDPRRFWHASLAELGAKRLQELAAKYGADYVLTEAPGLELPPTAARPEKIAAPKLPLTILYQNAGYVVYRLHDGHEP